MAKDRHKTPTAAVLSSSDGVHARSSAVPFSPLHTFGNKQKSMADLAPRVGTADERRCTQIKAKAVQLLGVSRSRVSDLVRGKWEKFSFEMLITRATRAGIHVHIKIAA
jgi:hypothetical protein